MGRVPVNITLPLGATQREKVIWLLRFGDAVCSTTFLAEFTRRASWSLPWRAVSEFVS